VQQAVELARLAVNKTIVPERTGRGRRGYGRRLAVKLFVFAQLVGIHKDKSLEKFLRENRGIAMALGFRDGIPDRTTIGRWKGRLGPVVRDAFEKLASINSMFVPAELFCKASLNDLLFYSHLHTFLYFGRHSLLSGLRRIMALSRV